MLSTFHTIEDKPLQQSKSSTAFVVTAKLFTSTYSSKEDRIRLTINYDDYTQRVDFWITRSFFLKLLPIWEEFFYKHSTTTEILQISNISNASKTDIHTLELTQKVGGLLESVDMQFNREKNRFKITLKGSNIEALADLSPQMMINLLRSIFQSAPHMQWGISQALLG